MTREQIIWELAIGFVILIVGAVLGPLFKLIWQRINRPVPLTPQDKGKLAEQIAMNELELKRLRHFSDHPNDRLLYLFQLGAAVLLCSILAASAYIFVPSGNQALALAFVMVSLGLCVVSIVEGERLSDRKIGAAVERIEKRIADDTTKLNAPN